MLVVIGAGIARSTLVLGSDEHVLRRRPNGLPTVDILYDPDDPERFRIDTLLGRGGCLPAVAIVIGLGFVAIGALMLSIASS